MKALISNSKKFIEMIDMLQLRRKRTNTISLIPFREVTAVCFGIVEHIVTPRARTRGFLCLQDVVQYVL